MRIDVRSLPGIALLLTLVALLGMLMSCAEAPRLDIAGLPVHHGQAQVAIQGQEFVPRVLVVAPGTRVTWMNKDALVHSVTEGRNADAVPGGFNSGPLTGGQSWSHTFDKPGTYQYTCAYHPDMNGFIVVKK